MKIIQSPQNDNIKKVLKIIAKSSARKKDGLIAVEGFKEISMALVAGLKIQELYYCPEFNRERGNINDLQATNIISITNNIFKKISHRENPDGFLALLTPKHHNLNDFDLSQPALFVLLESVEKPGNLGAIIRSTDASGATGIIITDPRTDIFNPNIIRSSRGAVFTTKIAICSNQEALIYLQKNNITILAATSKTDQLYSDANLQQSIAISIGTEHEGLSSFWLEQNIQKIKIPLLGKIDSLNASVSAAVILFEALRQRNS